MSIQKLVRTNIETLKKDKRTGAIINTDVGQYEMIKAARRKDLRLQGLEEAIKQLQKDVEEIKKCHEH